MRLTDAARTHVHPIATPDPSHRCTDWCVSPPLLLGQGGDEFAAEVGNVGDHAAPDQVKSSHRSHKWSPEVVSHALKCHLSPGWCGCWCSPRGDEEAEGNVSRAHDILCKSFTLTASASCPWRMLRCPD